MPKRIRVYVEAGSRRVFAGALDWPGWCRSGRDEGAALDALVAYAQRYAEVVGGSRQLSSVDAASDFEIVDRLKGDAGTDFGAPSIAPRADAAPLSRTDLRRLEKILRACWSAFDASARTHAGATLTKGPRGGGREIPAMIEHVRGAEHAYVSGLAGPRPADDSMSAVRDAFIAAVRARVRGEPVPENKRRTKPVWTPRYGIRRSAWHALDHAWEIEDRLT